MHFQTKNTLKNKHKTPFKSPCIDKKIFEILADHRGRESHQEIY